MKGNADPVDALSPGRTLLLMVLSSVAFWAAIAAIVYYAIVLINF
jgi:hypothetical protein